MCSSTDQGGGKRRLGLGTASFLLAISMFQHAIPTHIRPQVRDLALRGLVAMMIAVELTTLLWWRRADDDHQNEGCGIDHGDLFTRSAKRLTKEEARRMVVNFANVAAWPKGTAPILDFTIPELHSLSPVWPRSRVSVFANVESSGTEVGLFVGSCRPGYVSRPPPEDY